jgi:hypothetical protein
MPAKAATRLPALSFAMSGRLVRATSGPDAGGPEDSTHYAKKHALPTNNPKNRKLVCFVESS